MAEYLVSTTSKYANCTGNLHFLKYSQNKYFRRSAYLETISNESRYLKWFPQQPNQSM